MILVKFKILFNPSSYNILSEDLIKITNKLFFKPQYLKISYFRSTKYILVHDKTLLLSCINIYILYSTSISYTKTKTEFQKIDKQLWKKKIFSSFQIHVISYVLKYWEEY